MKRFFIAVLTCALALPAFATGVEEEEATYQVQIMLIDGHDGLWDLTPTENTTPTAEQPIVRTAMATLKAEFEEMHPDTEIVFLRYPPMDRAGLSQWYATKRANDDLPQIGIDPLLTQMEGGTTPEWWVNLAPYLEAPNPFVPGNERWLDLLNTGDPAFWFQWFQDTWTNDPNPDNRYMFPLSMEPFGQFFIVNRAAFEDAGLDPDMELGGYGDLIAVWQQLQEAGYIPYLPQHPVVIAAHLTIHPIMADSLIAAASLPMAWRVPGGRMRDGVQREETIRAYQQNELLTANDPRAVAWWRYAKEMAGYYAPGWDTLDADQKLSLWRSGKVAMKGAFAKDVSADINDPQRPFDIGIMSIPVIQPEEEPLVSTTATPIVNAGIAYQGDFMWVGKPMVGVMADATEDPELLDRTIKWLQFITTPEANELYINEAGNLIPSVQGAAYPPGFEIVADIPSPGAWSIVVRAPGRAIEEMAVGAPPLGTDAEAESKMTRLSIQYRNDQISEEEFHEEWRKIQEANVERALAQYGYDTSKW